MTESEWLDSTNPMLMLELLRGKISGRKAYLFACACYRQVWDHLSPDHKRQVVFTEQYADRSATGPPGMSSKEERNFAWEAAQGGSQAAMRMNWRAEPQDEPQCRLLRDIFGNPFRPARLNPSWLRWNKGCVVELASVIYDERRFSDMGILADALEEAGCTNRDILDHCRQPAEHVRGCWLVDLILDKK